MTRFRSCQIGSFDEQRRAELVRDRLLHPVPVSDGDRVVRCFFSPDVREVSSDDKRIEPELGERIARRRDSMKIRKLAAISTTML